MKRAIEIVVIGLFIAVLAVVGVTFGDGNDGARPVNIPSFAGATGWLNSKALSASDLKGKVVVVNVWTYTCINWLRTLPHVRAWAERYKDHGLVVIGVHSPEFPFEHDVDNVRRAAKAMRVEWPIALDNDFAVWRALDNQYWPALYIIDAKGKMRYQHFGEGKYEESERVIQKLLAEAGHGDVGDGLSPGKAVGIEKEVDWANLKSPETYVGYGQSENFASPGGAERGEKHVYSVPERLGLNHWALSGDWTITERAGVLNKAGGRIAYRFHARDVHLVMAPGKNPARFRVLVDGQPPGAGHGTDVDENGNGVANDARTYQLIRQAGPVVDRLFEIEFLDPGAQAFCFTFG